MKIRQPLLITTLVGLFTLGFSIPSHAQEYHSPCPSIPLVTPSKEMREIRVDKYKIVFKIPANYRTQSYSYDNKLSIEIYNPSSLEEMECMRKNRVSGEEDYSSASVVMGGVKPNSDLTGTATKIAGSFRSRGISNIKKLTIANQPAVSYNYPYMDWENAALLLFTPDKQSFVNISYDPTGRTFTQTLGNQIAASIAFFDQ